MKRRTGGGRGNRDVRAVADSLGVGHHGAQESGAYFSRVVVDLTGGIFAGGQTYVALSRCNVVGRIGVEKQDSAA